MSHTQRGPHSSSTRATLDRIDCKCFWRFAISPFSILGRTGLRPACACADAVGARPRLRHFSTGWYDLVRGAPSHCAHSNRNTFCACAPHLQHQIKPPDFAIW